MIKVSNFKVTEHNGLKQSVAINKPDGHWQYKLLRVTTPQLTGTLSVKQFANAADISPQAVRKMIGEERLVAERVGNEYLIKSHELTRYLQSR